MWSRQNGPRTFRLSIRDSKGRMRVTDVRLQRREPVVAVFGDSASLRSIGALESAEAERPFALVFPCGRFGESTLRSVQKEEGRHIISAPAGLPIGACKYQKVHFRSKDGQPMEYTCTYEADDRDENHELLGCEFYLNAANNTLHIQAGVGGVCYSYDDSGGEAGNADGEQYGEYAGHGEHSSEHVGKDQQ